MSFFGSNEIGSIGNIQIEAAEGYSGAIGAQVLMVEGFQNDMDMFVESLLADRKEYNLVREGASEDEVLSVQESALGGFWNKIKEFIKKIIAKIKGLFKGFIAKFEAWMGRDGKAFFEKYKKDIFGSKDLDGLTVRFSKPKFSAISVDIDGAKPNESLGDKDKSDLVNEYLGAITTPKVSGTEKGSFRKDFHEQCFEDEDKSFDVTRSNVADLVKYISGKEDLIGDVKKMADKQEKGLNEYIKIIDKYAGKATDQAVNKATGKDGGENVDVHKTFNAKADGASAEKRYVGVGNATGRQKEAASLQHQASAMQEALGVANAAALTEIKFAVAQSRRIAAAVVAYGGKKHEDTDLIAAMEEAAEYEVLSALEAID